MRLTKLQIAGGAIAVVWAFVAGLVTHNSDMNSAVNFGDFAYKVCIDGNIVRGVDDPLKCERERAKNYAVWMKNDTGNTLVAAVVPIPAILLVAFCLVYFVRAQVAGFRTVVPWRDLSRPRKGFVLFCVAFVVASGLIGVLVLMNEYVDSEVPVMLPSKSFSKFSGNERVEVVGTWTRTDLGDDDTIASPLQTSRIICVKSENRCTEAQAHLSGDVLFSDSVEYTIQSWTDAAIVLRNDFPCATEVFTIDLNTQVVSGRGHKTNAADVLCRGPFNTGSEEWSYLMEDGFKVYWAQRQKAKPFILRVMQSLSGN